MRCEQCGGVRQVKRTVSDHHHQAPEVAYLCARCRGDWTPYVATPAPPGRRRQTSLPGSGDPCPCGGASRVVSGICSRCQSILASWACVKPDIVPSRFSKTGRALLHANPAAFQRWKRGAVLLDLRAKLQAIVSTLPPSSENPHER